jgi:hypothetical protein
MAFTFRRERDATKGGVNIDAAAPTDYKQIDKNLKDR